MISTDTLSIDVIRRHLGTGTAWHQIYLFDEVVSTNRVLRQLARSGAAEGTVVLADSQSEGRARLGRAWFSPSGVNLYVSALFREGLVAKETPLFCFIASLAVADAIKDLGLCPAIKWPNDVLVDGKKLAGALMECATRGERVDFLVVGVGVNVNVDAIALHAALGPAGVAATSLSMLLGRDVDRNAFAALYLGHLDGWARRFRADGAGAVLASWRERDVLTGRRVEARGPRESFDGRVVGINNSGQLLIQPSLGEPRAVIAEEIRVLD